MFFSKKTIATVILPVFSVNAADNESVNVANEEDIQNIKQDEDSITLDLQGVSSEEESYMYKVASIGAYLSSIASNYPITKGIKADYNFFTKRLSNFAWQ